MRQIIYQDWIVRSDLRSNPDRIYVFGDNVERAGFGGQAKEMRGEPNAIGVATKWSPSMQPRAFFDDTAECRRIVEQDLALVRAALDLGRTVVVPRDGIGSGLSQLDRRAPHLLRFMNDWFSRQQRMADLNDSEGVC
jgi:hypothetical protein